jgi:twitching motility protein PilT
VEIAELLTFTKQQGASDLHLSAGLPPMIRLHGSLRRLKMDPLTQEETRRILYSILTEEQRKRLRKIWNWISLTR